MSELSPYVTTVSGEEEFGVRTVDLGSKQPAQPIDPHLFDRALQALVDEEAAPTDGSPAVAYATHVDADSGQIEYFRANADKVHIDSPLPERALGEYPSIDDAVIGLRTNERFIIAFGAMLLRQNPDIPAIIINRRTGTPNGKTAGRHHNFGLGQALEVGIHPVIADREQRIIHMLQASARMRPYMTGAGSYDHSGRLSFSQKLAALASGDLHNVGFTIAQIKRDAGFARLEDRTPDIGLIDDAVARCLGDTALGISLALVPALYNEFSEDIRRALTRQDLEYFNQPNITPDGFFVQPGQPGGEANVRIRQGVEFTMRKAETFVDRMRLHAPDPPEHLLKAARSIYTYSDLMLSALRAEVSVHALRAKADWAAKDVMVRGLQAVAQKDGRSRTAADCDPLYDTIVLRRDGDKIIVDERLLGYGYKLRDTRNAFEGTVPAAQVEAAYYQPPRGRGTLRGGAIAKGVAVDATWRSVTFNVGESVQHVIDLPDPEQTRLDRHDAWALEHATPYRRPQ